MTKILISQVVLVCLLAMTGCSGGIGREIFGTVAHASGFSNSTLTGAYAFAGQATTFESQGSKKSALVGFVILDGNGNISSGLTTEVNEQFVAICTFSLSGTYSVNSNGTGTATMTTSNTAGSCPNKNSTFALALSSRGNQVNLVETTLTNVASAVLYKQEP